MDPQEIEVDSVADLRVALEDNVDLDTVRDIAEGEMLPAPEDAVLDAAGDLGYPDASTPLQTTDSVSAVCRVQVQLDMYQLEPVWLARHRLCRGQHQRPQRQQCRLDLLIWYLLRLAFR